MIVLHCWPAACSGTIQSCLLAHWVPSPRRLGWPGVTDWPVSSLLFQVESQSALAVGD